MAISDKERAKLAEILKLIILEEVKSLIDGDFKIQPDEFADNIINKYMEKTK